MIYHDMTSYLSALNNYNSTPGKIINGEGLYLVDGKWVSDEEYFNHNSRPVYERPPKNNADSTSISPSIVIRKRT